MATVYNPDERWEIPRIGIPTIRVPKLPLVNVFGERYRGEYEVVDTDEPYLLWENGMPMLWENKENIKLEEQKKRIWLQKARR